MARSTHKLWLDRATDSNHFEWKGCHPDIDLLKALFENLFECDEELSIFFRIRNIDEYTDGFIPVNVPFMPPLTRDCLALMKPHQIVPPVPTTYRQMRRWEPVSRY
jgi:hypothetical protein